MSGRGSGKFKRITSMSLVRFEELCLGIIDGTLPRRWEGKAEADALTKAEKVELRQLNALQVIAHERPDILTKLCQETRWRQLEILKDEATDMVFARIK